MGIIYKNGIPYGGDSGSQGTSDYNELINKPQINGVTLSGNKTLEDLGIIEITSTEIDDIIDNVFNE